MNAEMKLLLPIVAFVMCSSVFGEERVYRIDHVVVTHETFPSEYAEAIARTAGAARTVAVEKFGFDMPQTIKISAKCDSNQNVRLFNDGHDRFTLTVRSEEDLLKPGKSGIFNIYGICHEVGHLAMYRVIRDHSWLTSAGAEGWAHYIGSRIVDDVYNLEKERLWPDRYDYLADGTKRLKAQLAGPDPSDTAKGAALWMELAEIVGDKNLASIFKAWAEAKIDPTDPGAALRRALLSTNDDTRLSSW